MEYLAEKKKAILESTLALIEEKGFHGTPMSMVAKHAGVAAGTIYHYFDSKERLICELYTYVNQRMISALLTSDDPAQSFQKRFFSTWMGLYHFYIENPNVLRFMEQFVNSPFYTKSKGPQHHPVHQLLFDFFRCGVEEGQLCEANPEMLGVLVHGSIITAAKIHGVGKIQLSDEELTQIARILWNGMSRPAST
ncbi:TetR/AcrR family transcriptional regulator [Pontibacter chitinilyticus]|uniref:TetR/AcrR family transcriptional regulator n=1 Tax=Pontibacter chitinilyticus TaxID=2674989 RepID=UPI00321B51E5